jgi:hypothetical protein
MKLNRKGSEALNYIGIWGTAEAGSLQTDCRLPTELAGPQSSL